MLAQPLVHKIKLSALEHLRAKNDLFIKLCQPLHDLGVHYYYFIKCHEDGSYLKYSNRQELVELHIQEVSDYSQFFKERAVDVASNEKTIFSLMGNINQFDIRNDPVLQFLWDHGCWNALMLYKIKNQNILEGWGFSPGSKCPDPIEYFLRTKPFLERFISYFEVVGKDLIDTSDKNKLAIYEGAFGFFNQSLENKNNEKILDFLRKTQLKKLPVYGQDHLTHFTQRQEECLYYLSEHYTIKEIAQLLELSPRSVETYVQTVKNKIGVSSKSDLLKFVERNDLKQKLELLNSVR